MAATQLGTGSLVVAGQAAAAATYITIPSGWIVESYNLGPGGSPDIEDVVDEDGAHHTRLVFEKGMSTGSVVLVGKAYTKSAGEIDTGKAYIETVNAEKTKGALRTTVTFTLIPKAT